MKTAEELARGVVLETFMGYSAKGGFMCQMHFPDFQNALTEHDNEIKALIDDMMRDLPKGVGKVSHKKYTHNPSAEEILTELRSKI